MVKLSANQAILLLQIYRGTLNTEFKIGTFKRDIHCLLSEGYIEPEGAEGWATTHEGNVRVSKMLGFGIT